MRSRSRAIVLVVIAIMLAGCAPRAFDEARWNASPAFAHPAAMAEDIVERDLVSGLTSGQVVELLGKWDADDLPALIMVPGETPEPSASGTVVYQLKGGGILSIEFTDSIVSSAKVEGR